MSTAALCEAPSCLECNRPADRERGWRAFRCDIDDDGHDDVLIYCPPCSEREFGETY